MKLITRFSLAACVLGLFMAQALWAQHPRVSIKIYGTDVQVGLDSVVVGVDTSASGGIDTVLGERELPPLSPSFNFRAVSYLTVGTNIGQGSKIDYHKLIHDGQRDVYKLEFNRDDAGSNVHFWWAPGLATLGAGYWHLVDNPTTPTIDIDMTKDTSYTYPSTETTPNFLYIIKGDGKAFRTVVYDSLTAAHDHKGKVLKIEKAKALSSTACFVFPVPSGDTVTGLHVEYSQGLYMHLGLTHFTSPPPDALGKTSKFDYVLPAGDSLFPGQGDSICVLGAKGKPLAVKKYWWVVIGQTKPVKLTGPAPSFHQELNPMPNWTNMLQELYLQPGGFAAPNGLTLGLLTQVAVVDSVKLKPVFRGIIHPKFGDVIKTMFDKTAGVQDGPATCLRTIGGKAVVKVQKTLSPKKAKNALVGAMVALKFNIMMNNIGKVEDPETHQASSNFDLLGYSGSDSVDMQFDGLTVAQIAARADSFLSCALPYAIDSSKLLGTIQRINAAFSAEFDTVSFAGKTIVPGIKMLYQNRLYRASLVEAAPLIATGWVRPEVPLVYTLSQNYPNPFNPTTTIEFNLPEASIVTLKVYDILGQEVATLGDHQQFEDGPASLEFDASHLASGVYFYRLVVNDGQWQQVKKMMLLK